MAWYLIVASLAMFVLFGIHTLGDPLQGSVVSFDDENLSGIFVEVDDFVQDPNVSLEFSTLTHSKPSLDEMIVFEQTLIIENLHDAEYEARINLWNHDETPTSLLAAAQSMQISHNGTTMSEAPVVILTLEEGARVALDITYQTPPVEEDSWCELRTVADIIPEDAQIINSDIELTTVVEEECIVSLSHPFLDDFSGLAVPVSVDESRVREIRYGDSQLTIEDGMIIFG